MVAVAGVIALMLLDWLCEWLLVIVLHRVLRVNRWGSVLAPVFGVSRCFRWSVHHLLVLVVVLLLLPQAIHWNALSCYYSWGSPFSVAATQASDVTLIHFVHVHCSLRRSDNILTYSSWIRVSLSFFLWDLRLYLYWVTGLNRLSWSGSHSTVIWIAIRNLSGIDRIVSNSHVKRNQRTLSSRLFVVSKMSLLSCRSRHVLLLPVSYHLSPKLRVRIIL